MVANKLKEITYSLYGRGIRPIASLLRMDSKQEKYVFWFSVSYFYILLFSFLCLKNGGQCMTLMGYDTVPNSAQYDFPYVHCWHLRHPLFAFLYLPITLIKHLLALFGIYSNWIIYTLPTPLIFASCNLLLFKILRENKVKCVISVVSIILFSGFAHVILLSGQFESFPLTMFFSLLFLLYTIRGRKNTWKDNVVFAGIVGVTSTNMLKVFLTWLLNCGKDNGIRRCIKAVCLFCVLMTVPTLQLILSSVRHGDFWGHFITNATGYSYIGCDTFHALRDNFFCEPLFFHNTNEIFYDFNVLSAGILGNPSSSMTPYTYSIIPVCIILIYALAIGGLIRQRHLLMTKVIGSFFVVDLFVLLVLGYGKNEAQLFCLHWIWAIPLLIGVFLNSVSTKRLKMALCAIILTISTVAYAHNLCSYYGSLVDPNLADDYKCQLDYLKSSSCCDKAITDKRLFLFGMGGGKDEDAV